MVVEVEVLLPADMSVRESHDIALALQHKVRCCGVRVIVAYWFCMWWELLLPLWRFQISLSGALTAWPTHLVPTHLMHRLHNIPLYP